MKEHCEKLLEANMIVPTNTTTWLAAATVVPKKDPVTGEWNLLRFCVDYRKLNEATLDDPYPLPRTDMLLDELAGHAFYTTLDCLARYHSVDIAPASQPLTAFLTPFGIYSWRVMPFGVKNAPACYMRIIDHTLLGVKEAAAFVDDICQGADTEKAIAPNPETLLSKMAGAALRCKPLNSWAIVYRVRD
ncbi:MAG: hypothetical protein Pars2KO_33460 [Parasphingorhabdus sp.]